jgi:hypothetical protein
VSDHLLDIPSKQGVAGSQFEGEKVGTKNGKIFFGFSRIFVLLAGLWRKTITAYAPRVIS